MGLGCKGNTTLGTDAEPSLSVHDTQISSGGQLAQGGCVEGELWVPVKPSGTLKDQDKIRPLSRKSKAKNLG